MDSAKNSSGEGSEFRLKWDMGVRGASAIWTLLQSLDAKIEIHREGVRFDAKNIMWFLVATNPEGSPILSVRTSGPDHV